MENLTLEIHTYGGGEILERVFNGISRVFYSNNQYVTVVGQVFGVLGALYAAIVATVGGNIGKFVYHWLFPSVMVFVLAFFLKTTVHIHDHSNPEKQNIFINNIPFAASFFASVSSNIARYLTEEVEENLLPVDFDRNLLKRQGILFGAKLLGKLKEMRFSDSTIHSEYKHFAQQCIIKPFMVLNAGNLEEAVKSSPNILNQLVTNPSNNFGTFLRKNSLSSKEEYMTCAEAGAVLQKRFELEKVLLLFGLQNRIGVNTDGCDYKNPADKAYFIFKTGEDSLREFLHAHFNFHDWMTNAMLINATREAGDDLREEHGLSRRYVTAQATRGLFQQTMGSIVSGEMVSTVLPMLQYALLAVMICTIFVILPVAVLPGGWAIFKSWIFAIIWVNSWPVFYAIVNALGVHRISGALAPFTDGYNFNTVDDISEILLYNYGIFQMLAASVPIISYGLLKGSEYAMTQVASGFLSSGTGASIGSQAADGNLQMNNASVGRKVDFSERESYGKVVDFGGREQITDAETGRQIHKIRQNSLEGFSAMQSQTEGISESTQKDKLEQVSNAARENYTNSVNAVETDSIAFMTSITEGTRLSEQADAAEKLEFSKLIQEGFNRGLWGKGEIGVSAQGSLGKGNSKMPLSGNIGGGAGVGYGDNFTDNELVNRVLSSAATNVVLNSNGEENSAAKNLSQSYSKAQNYAKISESAETNLENFNKSQAYSESSSTTINKDLAADFITQATEELQAENKLITPDNLKKFMSQRAPKNTYIKPKNDIKYTPLVHTVQNKEDFLATSNENFQEKKENFKGQKKVKEENSERHRQNIEEKENRITQDNKSLFAQTKKVGKNVINSFKKNE